MALSASTNYYTTREDITKRAMRIIGAISQGETPSATAITEANITLNEIFKEWQADGLQLWKTTTAVLSGYTTNTVAALMGVGATWNTTPFLKLHSAYYTNTASGTDTPLTIITRDEYIKLSPKTQYSTPTSVYYRPPNAKDSAALSGNLSATVYFYPGLSTSFLAANSVTLFGTLPLMDFDASSDQPDIPDYMINALVWALADQLAYEYGVALGERSMITKKAMFHKAVALSYDQEEGSLFFRPETNWNE